jgi:uncharacterized protein
MQMRRAVFVTVLGCLGIAACGAPSLNDLPPPKLGPGINPNAVTTRALSGSTEPLVVDWEDDDRATLETNMNDGIAIVSYTSEGLRVLNGCTAEGTYGFIGMATKQKVIRLENQDEVKANLPLGGLGIAASMGGDFASGAVLDVGMVMIGKRRTTRRTMTKRDLVGNCKGATHFVRGALVGAFSINQGQKAQARAVAQIFGFGGSGAHSSNKGFQRTDGKLADCDNASADADRAPRQCSALVRLDLQEIPDDAVAVVKGPSATNDVDIVRCPSGMVMNDGKCTNGADVSSFECTGDNASECMQQCEKGNLASCTKRGMMGLNGANGANKEPVAAAKLLALACKNGNGRGCSVLGYVFQDPNLMQEPDSKGANDAFLKGCKQGDELGCYGLGSNVFFGRGTEKNQQAGIKLWAKACDGGQHAACSDLGVMYLGGSDTLTKDDVKAAKLFKSACEGGNAMGCGNLGYMVETGSGGRQKDIPLAAKLYEKACMQDDETCSSSAVLFQLGKGVAKNLDSAVKLHRLACKANATISCAFLKSFVDKDTAVNLDNAKSAFSVWKDTCTHGIVRDCTQAAIIAIALGLKDDGKTLMKTACQAGDDWACANTNITIR